MKNKEKQKVAKRDKYAYEILSFIVEKDLVFANIRGHVVISDDAEEKLEEFLKEGW